MTTPPKEDTPHFFPQLAPHIALAAGDTEAAKKYVLEHDATELAKSLNLGVDSATIAAMAKRNEEKLTQYHNDEEKAKEEEGDLELRDAHGRMADLYCRIGDYEEGAKRVRALQTMQGSSLGFRLDCALQLVRIELCRNDALKARTEVDAAKKLLAKGGDWERKNKLLVYEGYVLILEKQFAQAARKLIDAAPTFTASELTSFTELVRNLVIAALTALGRGDLKKVNTNPDVLQAIDQTPHLQQLLASLIKCDYKEYMEALPGILDVIEKDFYWQRSSRLLSRKLRLNGYDQFFRAYRTVTIDAVAKAFGVSPAFIDAELSQLVSAGQLDVRIDRVSMSVARAEQDHRGEGYLQVVRKGDLVVGELGKLFGVIEN